MIVSFYEKYAIKTCIFIFYSLNLYRRQQNNGDGSIWAYKRNENKYAIQTNYVFDNKT